MDAFDLRCWQGFSAAGGNPSFPAIIDQVTIDSRRVSSPHSLFIALPGKTHDGHSFIAHASGAGARYAIAKRGWISSTPLNNTTILYVENPLTALQQIAHAYRLTQTCRIVAIAGSYGKTMVKDLLQSMLSQEHCVVASPESFNSQIGVPISLLNISHQHDIALIEAAISHKGEMRILGELIAADDVVITHIDNKHITSLGNIGVIAEEISHICTSQTQSGWALLPSNKHLLTHSDRFPLRHYLWTSESKQLPQASWIDNRHTTPLGYKIDFPDETSYKGVCSAGFHYFLDLINITSKAAWLLKTSSASIAKTLEEYHPEPMRTEIWKTPAGATFINDTYCSDPQSIDIAMRHFEKKQRDSRHYFLFGGIRCKEHETEINYKRIGESIRDHRIDHLTLFGPHDFSLLTSTVKAYTPHLPIAYHSTYQEALRSIRDLITAKDTVLIKGDQKHPLEIITETFHDSICTNQCFINLAAIEENIRAIRHHLPPQTRIMAIVKALAYGTDDVRIGQFLAQCGIDILGVSYVDEGVALKRVNVTQAVFVINAAPYEAAKVVKWDLEVGVSDQTMVETLALEAVKQKKTIKVHLHVDTGMSRFGCRPEEAVSLASLIMQYSSLQFEGIMTHFACADDPEHDTFTLHQATLLTDIIRQLEEIGIDIPWSHAANSSAALRFSFPQFNMVRVGLAIYGLHTSSAIKEILPLRSALTLASRIVGINRCQQGDSVSYGRTYRVEQPQQRIAVLPIGYFDGLHRNYSGKSYVIIRGRRAPMVGRICMDFMMVDISDIPDATVGDPVLIFGEDEHGYYASPEELATQGNSIIHELITCLGPRIQRIFIYEESQEKHFVTTA